MRILGIDPGLASTGWAITDGLSLIAHGIISTKKWNDKEKTEEIADRDRIDTISERLDDIVIEFKPQQISIEDFVYFGNRGKTSSNMSALIENMRISFKQHNIPVTIYANGQWKRILLGNYRANKKQVEHYINRIMTIDFKDRGGHVYDSIGLALAKRKVLMKEGKC